METNSQLPTSPNNEQSTFRHVLINSFNHIYQPDYLRMVVAEVIATYLLVFMSCGAAAISGCDERLIANLAASLVGGLIVTVMVYAVGHISGAHMNPAVTLAFAATTNFPWKLVPGYIVAQVTGAISASFTLRELLHPIKLIGVTSPAGTDIQALIMEIIVSFCLMFVTSAIVTDSNGAGNLGGVAVGCSVCITAILAGPVSGGSMNPARTLGPALASRYYKSIWIYMVGPPLGTLLAACAYNFIRLKQSIQMHAISSAPSVSIERRRTSRESSHSRGTAAAAENNAV